MSLRSKPLVTPVNHVVDQCTQVPDMSVCFTVSFVGEKQRTIFLVTGPTMQILGQTPNGPFTVTFAG